MIFGLMAVVLVAFAGTVVDYTRVEERRNRAQIALDAAALALQPRIYDTSPEEIRVAAERLVIERLNDSTIEVRISNIDFDIDEGTLELHGSMDVPMAFAQIVGINSIRSPLLSEATRRKLELEIVMVLDNSGSMATGNRIAYLKQAAACATRTLFYDKVDGNCQPMAGSKQVEDVRIGIVPFTMFVNVGANNSSANWLDWTGRAAMSRDNFNTGQTPNMVNRAQLFSTLRTSGNQPVPWAGCVIARQSPFDTTDTPPDAAQDPRTLYTPLFAPDEPTGFPNDYISDTGGTCPVTTCTVRRTQNNCTQGYMGAITCRGSTSTTYIRQVGNQTTTSSNSCLTGGPQLSSSNQWNGSQYIQNTVYSLLSARELQEQTCKYTNAVATVSSTRGPNAHCPTISILPLTNNVGSVTARINAMVADGGTNIQQGAMWGWSVLSPELPFAEASPYDITTSKVMILMTDGENYNSFTSYPNNMNGTTYYSAYGHRYNSRLNGNNNAQMIAEMNRRTLETCRNAKAAGVTIYSIGLEVPNAETRDMMRDCATTPEFAYFPDQPQDLNTVFAAIADQLSALRLSR